MVRFFVVAQHYENNDNILSYPLTQTLGQNLNQLECRHLNYPIKKVWESIWIRTFPPFISQVLIFWVDYFEDFKNVWKIYILIIQELDQAQFQGRIRSFPHEKNNWASFIYIDVSDLELDEIRNDVETLKIHFIFSHLWAKCFFVAYLLLFLLHFIKRKVKFKTT